MGAIDFSTYQPFQSALTANGNNRATSSLGITSPMSPTNQSQPQRTGGGGQSMLGPQIANGLQQYGQQQAAQARAQVYGNLANNGNPVAQSALSVSPDAGAGTGAASAPTSSLVGDIGNNIAGGLDNSMAGRAINGVLGSDPGNGIAQQGMNMLTGAGGSAAPSSALGVGASAAGDAAASGAADAAAGAGAAGAGAAAAGGAAGAAGAAGGAAAAGGGMASALSGLMGLVQAAAAFF